jgi:hypothetical protein
MHRSSCLLVAIRRPQCCYFSFHKNNLTKVTYGIPRKSIFLIAWLPLVAKALLIVESSRSHSRHTTLGRTPLDEWSARRRDLYLTTHNTHKRQTSMPPAGFESAIPASELPQTHALDGAATGIGSKVYSFCLSYDRSIASSKSPRGITVLYFRPWIRWS